MYCIYEDFCVQFSMLPKKCTIHTFAIDSTLHHLALAGEEGDLMRWEVGRYKAQEGQS